MEGYHFYLMANCGYIEIIDISINMLENSGANLNYIDLRSTQVKCKNFLFVLFLKLRQPIWVISSHVDLHKSEGRHRY